MKLNMSLRILVTISRDAFFCSSPMNIIHWTRNRSAQHNILIQSTCSSLSSLSLSIYLSMSSFLLTFLSLSRSTHTGFCIYCNGRPGWRTRLIIMLTPLIFLQGHPSCKLWRDNSPKLEVPGIGKSCNLFSPPTTTRDIHVEKNSVLGSFKMVPELFYNPRRILVC